MPITLPENCDNPKALIELEKRWYLYYTFDDCENTEIIIQI